MDNQRSTKRQLRVLPTLTDPIGVCLFSSKSDDFGLVVESTSVSSVNYGIVSYIALRKERCSLIFTFKWNNSIIYCSDTVVFNVCHYTTVKISLLNRILVKFWAGCRID
jgi:hypothetical protein